MGKACRIYMKYFLALPDGNVFPLSALGLPNRAGIKSTSLHNFISVPPVPQTPVELKHSASVYTSRRGWGRGRGVTPGKEGGGGGGSIEGSRAQDSSRSVRAHHKREQKRMR